MNIDASTQTWLLRHAHHSLALAVGDSPPSAQEGPPPMPADPILRTPARAFVSWHNHGQLAGCVGTLSAELGLADTVARYAVQAGMHDTRFPALRPEQLEQLHCEISILGPDTPLSAVGLEQIEHAVTPNVDGVVMRYEQHRAVFLPVVWRSLPTPRAFLSALCDKAGINAGRHGAEVRASVFQTQTLRDPE